MAGLITEKNYHIHSFDVNYRYELLPTRFISFFQDIAMMQSEELGIGKEYLEKNNYSWVVIRYNIKIYKYPKYMDTIKLQTYPVYNRRLYAYRKFKTYNLNGELISEVDSAWTLLDRKKEKVCTMPSEMIEAYKYKDENDERISFNNIDRLNICDVQKTFKVRYSDIDSNLHVNNTVYVSWAIETMPLDDVVNYEIKNIEILFKKEALLGDLITVKTSLSMGSDTNIVAIHNICNQDGKILTLLRTKWNKREE